MRIGINARFLTLPFTGIGQYTRNLVMKMAEIEPENEYFLFVPDLVDINLPDNCHLVRVVEKENRSDSLKKTHWEHVLVPNEMEKMKLDLAHFPYPSNPCRKLNMSTVVTVHDVIPWKLKEYRRKMRSKLYHLYAKLALKKADHIITVSHFSKSEIIKYLKIKEKNITVTPLAAPVSDEKLNFPDIQLRRKFFLYVGGYDERKNVLRLIRAFEKHIAPTYSIDLIMVGGAKRGLENIITEEFTERVAEKFPLKRKGNVIFTDVLGQDELLCLYKQALALVHVSEYEGFNLALVEAMSAGIPIIASDIPVHHEVTAEHAQFVDYKNIDAIGNSMHQLVNDPSLRRRLSNAGKERVKDFSWQRTAEETLYVYALFL